MARTTWFFMFFIMAMLAIGYGVTRRRLPGAEADVRFQNAYNLSSEGKHEEAIVELKGALAKDPKHELARAKLAEEHEAIGNYGDALKEWQRLLRETSEALASGQKRPPVTKLGYVHKHLGICQLKIGKYKEALESFELALKTSSAQDEVQVLIGETYARRGQVKDAARSFLEAIQRAPQNAEAYRKLVDLYKEHGLDKKAQEVGDRMKAAGQDAAKEWEKLKQKYGW